MPSKGVDAADAGHALLAAAQAADAAADGEPVDRVDLQAEGPEVGVVGGKLVVVLERPDQAADARPVEAERQGAAAVVQLVPHVVLGPLLVLEVELQRQRAQRWTVESSRTWTSVR